RGINRHGAIGRPHPPQRDRPATIGSPAGRRRLTRPRKLPASRPAPASKAASRRVAASKVIVSPVAGLGGFPPARGRHLSGFYDDHAVSGRCFIERPKQLHRGAAQPSPFGAGAVTSAV